MRSENRPIAKEDLFMSLTRVHNFSIPLDGFGTGEGQTRETPFGHAGERLHQRGRGQVITQRGHARDLHPPRVIRGSTVTSYTRMASTSPSRGGQRLVAALQPLERRGLPRHL